MIKWQKIIGGSSTPLQSSTALKSPAAVQKVPGVGSLPFNETIKGPVSPSIDFSHSFSDKFELIIQCQAPGDVYFQHEGQLIHSVIFLPLPLTPSSLSCTLWFYIYPTLSLLLCFILIWWWKPAGRARTKERVCRMFSTPSFNFFVLCAIFVPCHVTSGVNLSANWGLIYSKVLGGGGHSLLSLRANVRWHVCTLPLKAGLDLGNSGFTGCFYRTKG